MAKNGLLKSVDLQPIQENTEENIESKSRIGMSATDNLIEPDPEIKGFTG